MKLYFILQLSVSIGFDQNAKHFCMNEKRKSTMIYRIKNVLFLVSILNSQFFKRKFIKKYPSWKVYKTGFI